MSSIKSIKELSKILKEQNSIKSGCLVDNSILFSLSYPLDTFNSDSEEIFNILNKNSVPDYLIKAEHRIFCVVIKICKEGYFISTAYTTNKMKKGRVIYKKEI